MVRKQQAGERVLNFFRERKYCDLCVRVQGKKFYCHRVILASKFEYFETALSNNNSIVELTLPDDVEPAIFEMILESVYGVSEYLRPDAKCIRSLLLASGRLREESLSSMCEAFIREHTHSLNLTEVFHVARAINHSSLVIYLTEYILARFVLFTRTTEFLKISFDDFLFLLIRYRDTSTPYANEAILVNAILRWTTRLPDEQRRSYLTQIVETLDLRERMSRTLIECARNIGDLIRDLNNSSPLMERKLNRSSPWPTLTCPVAQTYGTSTLHMVVRLPFLDSTNENMEEYVFVSLNELKVEPEWYPSYTLRKYATENAKGITVFPSQKHNLIYCFTRESPKSLRFDAFPSINFDSHRFKTLSVGYPIVNIRFPHLCGIDNCIYVYDTDLFHFVPRRIKRTDFGFTVGESKRGIYRYDCNVNLWSPVPAMRRKLAHSGVVTDDRLLYMIGGTKFDGQILKRYAQAYDHRAPTWLKLARTNHIYPYEPAGCAVNGKIYVCDGTRMEVLDPNAGRWENILWSGMKNDAVDWRPSGTWMIPHGNCIRIFVKKTSTFTIFDTETRTWSASYSFKNEIGSEDYSDYEDYGLQNVIYFESSNRRIA